jgi:hypothetical protein
MWCFTPYNRPNPAVYILVVICLGSGIGGQSLPGYLAYKLHKMRKAKKAMISSTADAVVDNQENAGAAGEIECSGERNQGNNVVSSDTP